MRQSKACSQPKVRKKQFDKKLKPLNPSVRSGRMTIARKNLSTCSPWVLIHTGRLVGELHACLRVQSIRNGPKIRGKNCRVITHLPLARIAPLPARPSLSLAVIKARFNYSTQIEYLTHSRRKRDQKKWDSEGVYHRSLRVFLKLAPLSSLLSRFGRR